MTDDLTDRDRLALAFNELTERGYYADITMSYRVCCRECALREMAVSVREHGEDPDSEIVELPDKFVFWHVQKDDYSFVGSSDGFPIPEGYQDKDDAWCEEHQDELDAVITATRLSQYVNLQYPLNMHWCGNADEIVGVLRKHGLKTAVPNDEHWCIEVVPTTTSARTRVPTPVQD